jgi:hypothetical protein
METFYAPYAGHEPATITVNGHRVIVLAHDQATIEETLDLFGGDSVHQLESTGENDSEELLAQISAVTKAHVVVTPSEASVPEILDSLKEALPWVQ